MGNENQIKAEVESGLITHDVARLPDCMHIEGSSCKCNGLGMAPQRIIPVRKNPEFTLKEVLRQTSEPVTSIDVDKRIPGYRLRKHCINVINHARKLAKEWVQGNKPVLPQSNSVACIDLYRGPRKVEVVKLCFDMTALYCKGVIVHEKLYELRLSNEESMFVDDSIALDCKETYYAMLGSSNPPVELSEYNFSRAYYSFMKLHPDAKWEVKRQAARMLGMLSLTLLEPSRQTKMMENVCSGDSAGGVYFKMNDEAWQVVHSWGRRSKRAMGIHYINEEIAESLSQRERFEAIQELNIVNSKKLLPVKIEVEE